MDDVDIIEEQKIANKTQVLSKLCISLNEYFVSQNLQLNAVDLVDFVTIIYHSVLWHDLKESYKHTKSFCRKNCIKFNWAAFTKIVDYDSRTQYVESFSKDRMKKYLINAMSCAHKYNTTKNDKIHFIS